MGTRMGMVCLRTYRNCRFTWKQETNTNLSNHLLPFQKADGGFSCLVFNPNERFESSGSALFGLLFVHAYRVSGDERYLNAAIKIEKALMKATRRDGTIDFAQGDTKGIGSYSQIFDRMPLHKEWDCIYLKH